MTSPGSDRAIGTALVATALAVLVSACQSSGSDGAAPKSPSRSTLSTGSISMPTPTPTVEPADGLLIDVPGATIRALDTYRQVADFGIVQGWGDVNSGIILAPSLTTATSLDDFADEYIREHGGKKFNKRVDNVVVGGKYNAWHVLNTSDPYEEMHYFGVMFLDGAWAIKMNFSEVGDPRPLTAQERTTIMDSLLVTFATHSENPK